MQIEHATHTAAASRGASASRHWPAPAHNQAQAPTTIGAAELQLPSLELLRMRLPLV